MAITLRQIDAFRAVMMTGTTIEAAQLLGITQPAISRLVADFEEAIGFKLFDRIGRRVLPTAEADILIEEVKRALTGLDQVRESAAEIARFRHARLRIISIPSVASTVVVDLIKIFADRYPDTFVSVEVRPSDAAVEHVVTQQCDLGIATPAVQTPAFESRTLLVGLSRCIVPKGHRLAERDTIRPEDLAGESFISFRPDSIFRSQLDAIFERHKVERMMKYEARTTEVVCSMVGAGLGVSVIGPLGWSRERESAEEKFVSRPFHPAPKVDLSLIWSTHRPLPAVARQFIEVIDEYVREKGDGAPRRP